MVKVTVSVSGIGDVFLSRLPGASLRLQQAVIASCEPFVPYRTGELCRSAVPEGEGPSGRIVYAAPHASRCYYAERPFRKKCIRRRVHTGLRRQRRLILRHGPMLWRRL